MRTILNKLKNLDNFNEYAPTPFWSWNNELQEDKLVAQIRHMKSVGCGGFMIHARAGLRTEYLSEDWFKFVGVCLKEAKAQKMKVWIYDENGWPSGFVGGKLLEDEKNRACYLEKRQSKVADFSAYAVFGMVGGRKCRLVEGMKSENGCYENIYVLRSPANTDILNPDVVSKFIQATHEQYYARFKDSFGKELIGFFTDEPQYFRWGTPFSFSLEEYWKENYLEDVRDGLIHLFTNKKSDYKYRARYYEAMNELHTNNYWKRLYDWCTEHGCMLTGHGVEETKLFTQMWGCAGCTPAYQYEHIPGIDNLGKFGTAMISARQVGSAAGQLGKKQVITETFGCSGYDTTPKELLAIAEKQYVHGVNYLCQHLYGYSLAGQGKVDHPPFFSYHITWQASFKDMNNYLTRLGYLLANSETQVNCAVINPMASVYLKYRRNKQRPALTTDKKLEKLQKVLDKKGILYDFIDEAMLKAHGKVNDAVLSVGKRNYEYIIVPYCTTLAKNTRRFLKEYVQNGGKVYVVKAPKYIKGIYVQNGWNFLKTNVTLDQISAGGKVRISSNGLAEYTYRKGDGFEFLYIVNVDDHDLKVSVPEGFDKVNLFNNEISEYPNAFILKKGESVILTPKTENSLPHVKYGKLERIKQLPLVASTENCLVIDNTQISFDGVNFSKKQPLAQQFERLLRMEYCGKLFVKYTFNIKDCFRGYIKLRRESNRYLSAKLNGYELDFFESPFDFKFEEAFISNYIKNGINEYVVEMDFYQRPHVFWALFDKKATESVRNCLYYDTEVENVYLLGDFTVDKKHRICPRKLPNKTFNLQKNGFPFFSGNVTYKTKVFCPTDKAQFEFRGRYMYIDVYVNGKFVDRSAIKRTLEIPVPKGQENEFQFIVVSSLRNTFGPFHYSKGEKAGVGPFSFTLRGSWKHGVSVYFRKKYSLSPFGLKRVRVAFSEE